MKSFELSSNFIILIKLRNMIKDEIINRKIFDLSDSEILNIANKIVITIKIETSDKIFTNKNLDEFLERDIKKLIDIFELHLKYNFSIEDILKLFSNHFYINDEFR